MGFLRKTLSLGSGGLVDFRSDKERTAAYTRRTRKEAIRQTLLQTKRSTEAQDWQKNMVKSYCKTIAYQTGYAPAPGQDPCKTQSATTAATT